tara:strand:- start:3026 stop:3151 length:126 start_codon:yes stop_codon:yes gene_type:complete
MNNKYTNKEIDDICWYYGQIKENLSDLMIKMLINRYEEENK